MDNDVLIVGAGPTGLTLAIDLGRRGVRCTLIEQKDEPAFLPKMERINARTMEIYRRMGLAETVRAAGLPAECPMDVFIVLSLVEPPLLHLPYPSVAEAKKIIDERGLPVSIEVDGGIDEHTAVTVAEAGARIFVSGSAVFGDERPWEAVDRIRTAVIGAFDSGSIR